MSNRTIIAILIYMMVNAVVFGFGMILVLTIPALSVHAWTLIPGVILVSFVLSAPVSWALAPRLQARYWRARELAGTD
jgi:hypothetical protein